jgi:hypothetical protein
MLMLSINYSCDQPDESLLPDEQVSENVSARLKALGFDVTNQAPLKLDGGYYIEGDIFLTDQDLAEMKPAVRIPQVEHYATTNLVKATVPKTISVFLPGLFDATYSAALDEALARYNAQGLGLTFVRVGSMSARPRIVFKRLPKGAEKKGILGSAGFPTSYGTPFGSIKMNSQLVTLYGLSVNGIATIMAHEIGHCIGFRHTDYFNRAISCGGAPANEGGSGVGANHIEGTPTGASLAEKSWMLACTDGGNRPFNAHDIIALKALYGLDEE